MIVDTAGFRNRTTVSALVAADLAIIPLKPAAEDLDCAIATIDLIREINETPERRAISCLYSTSCSKNVRLSSARHWDATKLFR